MLERCFFQFQSSVGVPLLEKGGSSVPVQRFWLILRKPELREEEEKNMRSSSQMKRLSLIMGIPKAARQMSADFRDVITHPNYCLSFLQPGRLLKVKWQKLDFGWGVIINYQKRVPAKVRDRARASFAESVNPILGSPYTETGRMESP